MLAARAGGRELGADGGRGRLACPPQTVACSVPEPVAVHAPGPAAVEPEAPAHSRRGRARHHPLRQDDAGGAGRRGTACRRKSDGTSEPKASSRLAAGKSGSQPLVPRHGTSSTTRSAASRRPASGLAANAAVPGIPNSTKWGAAARQSSLPPREDGRDSLECYTFELELFIWQGLACERARRRREGLLAHVASPAESWRACRQWRYFEGARWLPGPGGLLALCFEGTLEAM